MDRDGFMHELSQQVILEPGNRVKVKSCGWKLSKNCVVSGEPLTGGASSKASAKTQWKTRKILVWGEARRNFAREED